MKKLSRVLIMAGGTGGHVFPGLSVAEYLRAQDVDVQWLGTELGLEAKLVPAQNIPLHFIAIKGLRGKGIKQALLAPFKVGAAMMAARKIIRQLQPDVVLGMGGFVSGPGGIASKMLGIPLVIHEQNAKAGFTNKVLSSFAKAVIAGFPSAFKNSPKIKVLGNPVRATLTNLPTPSLRFKDQSTPCRVLVIGGSLGAQAINEVLPQVLALLPQMPILTHQVGSKHMETTIEAYRQAGFSPNANLQIIPFIEDMALAYGNADLVICRAGALTVAELCAVGLPAILIPYPFAVDDHQTANAMYLVDKGAAFCMQQRDLTAQSIANLLQMLQANPEKRLHMANAAYALRNVHVVQQIFDILAEASKRSGNKIAYEIK